VNYIHVQQNTTIYNLEAGAESRPYLDSVMRDVGFLLRVEVRAANLLKSYSSQHAVEETFQEVQHVSAVLLANALHPLNLNFVVDTV